MNNVYGNPIPPSPYIKNETMKLLGRQYFLQVLRDNPNLKNEIDDISEARPFSFTFDAAIDLIMLGFIYGKRAESAKRHK